MPRTQTARTTPQAHTGDLGQWLRTTASTRAKTTGASSADAIAELTEQVAKQAQEDALLSLLVRLAPGTDPAQLPAALADLAEFAQDNNRQDALRAYLLDSRQPGWARLAIALNLGEADSVERFARHAASLAAHWKVRRYKFNTPGAQYLNAERAFRLYAGHVVHRANIQVSDLPELTKGISRSTWNDALDQLGGAVNWHGQHAAADEDAPSAVTGADADQLHGYLTSTQAHLSDAQYAQLIHGAWQSLSTRAGTLDAHANSTTGGILSLLTSVVRLLNEEQTSKLRVGRYSHDKQDWAPFTSWCQAQLNLGSKKEARLASLVVPINAKTTRRIIELIAARECTRAAFAAMELSPAQCVQAVKLLHTGANLTGDDSLSKEEQKSRDAAIHNVVKHYVRTVQYATDSYSSTSRDSKEVLQATLKDMSTLLRLAGRSRSLIAGRVSASLASNRGYTDYFAALLPQDIVDAVVFDVDGRSESRDAALSVLIGASRAPSRTPRKPLAGTSGYLEEALRFSLLREQRIRFSHARTQGHEENIVDVNGVWLRSIHADSAVSVIIEGAEYLTRCSAGSDMPQSVRTFLDEAVEAADSQHAVGLLLSRLSSFEVLGWASVSRSDSLLGWARELGRLSTAASAANTSA